MSDKQLPLYSFPYRGKPRFLTEGLLRDDETTTTTNIQIMWQNSDFVQFHTKPFPDISKFLQSPSTVGSFISPLTSPSSIDSINSTDMPSTELDIRRQKVIKQIQYLICYVIYELVFSKKTTTKKDLINLCYENFHGDASKPHVLHHAWYFTQGKGKFGAVMQRSALDGQLHLLQEATREEDYDFVINEIPIVGDNSKVITLANIKRKTINSNVPVSPRSVKLYAEKALKNCKLAACFGKQFIQLDGNLASGWSRKDYFDKVLDLMYEKLRNEPKGKKIEDGDAREEVFQEKRPSNWVFNGFMAFVAFGPLATNDEWKSSLMTGSKTIHCVDCVSCIFDF
jgi:hypothetical protein